MEKDKSSRMFRILILAIVLISTARSFRNAQSRSRLRAWTAFAGVKSWQEDGFRTISKIAKILTFSSCVVLNPIEQLQSFNSISPTYSSQVWADSTGKFSTKLTARKRYLPVILQEKERFNKFSLKSDPASLRLWIEQDYPKLRKCMLLYGVSLRRAENPDEISRKAEQLTNQFSEEISNLSQAITENNQDSMSKALLSSKSAFEAYLEFSNINKEEQN